MEYYKRQSKLDEIGEEGQKKLKDAKVLVIGAGGLGCPALEYLATAGVGTIGIIDFDTVSETNLARQILYNYDDIGDYKAVVAKRKLEKMNPYITIRAWVDKITEDNIYEYINGFDYILDSPDNLKTRYLIEEVCTLSNKTIIHGSILRFMGQVTIFAPETPCYRCIYPEVPSNEDIPTCDIVGVFPALPSIIGVMQAIETIKIIVGFGENLKGKLLCYNALDQSIMKYNLIKEESCPICNKTV